jgi:type IV pilus assembly protein PilM
MQSGRLVAIDLVDRDCRAVEINITADGIEVTGVAHAALPGRLEEVSPEAAGGVLREALDAARLSARQAVMTIPRHLAILKPLVLPPMDAQDLPAAVRLQAEHELPYALTEAHVDYAPTGVLLGDGAAEAKDETAPAGLGLFLSAVQHSVVEQRRAFLAGAGLLPRRMGLRPNAAASALVFAGLDTTDEYVALVDLGDQMTEIDVLRNRHLVFSRSAAIGGAASAEAPAPGAEDGPPAPAAAGLSIFERQQTALIAELRRSLEAFAVQPGGGPVARLYLTGVNAQDEALAGAIAEALGIPVATFDPFEKVTLGESLRQTPRSELSAYATALGMVAAEVEDLVPGFDFLLPLEERMKPAVKKRPWAAIVGAALGLLVLVGAPIGYYQARQSQLKALTLSKNRVQAEFDALKKVQAKVDALSPWADPDVRLSWLDALDAVNTAWPERQTAYLFRLQTAVRPDQPGTLTLDGRAQNSAIVSQIYDALRRDPRIASVNPGAQVYVPNDPYGYTIQFQFKVEYRVPRPTTTRSAP